MNVHLNRPTKSSHLAARDRLIHAIGAGDGPGAAQALNQLVGGLISVTMPRAHTWATWTIAERPLLIAMGNLGTVTITADDTDDQAQTIVALMTVMPHCLGLIHPPLKPIVTLPEAKVADMTDAVGLVADAPVTTPSMVAAIDPSVTPAVAGLVNVLTSARWSVKTARTDGAPQDGGPFCVYLGDLRITVAAMGNLDGTLGGNGALAERVATALVLLGEALEDDLPWLDGQFLNYPDSHPSEKAWQPAPIASATEVPTVELPTTTLVGADLAIGGQPSYLVDLHPTPPDYLDHEDPPEGSDDDTQEDPGDDLDPLHGVIHAKTDKVQTVVQVYQHGNRQDKLEVSVTVKGDALREMLGISLNQLMRVRDWDMTMMGIDRALDDLRSDTSPTVEISEAEDGKVCVSLHGHALIAADPKGAAVLRALAAHHQQGTIDF